MEKGKRQESKKMHPAFLLLGGVLAGAALYAGLQAAFTFVGAPSQGQYQFTNPNLETQPFKEVFSTGGRNVLQQQLADYLQASQADGSVAQAGIYFRDLNNGPVFGINQDLQFYPASLLKLPLEIAYYRQVEDTDQGLLDQEIQFTGPKGVSVVHYPPPQSIEAGKTYTIGQLINLMLVDSDNDATNILGQYLPSDKVMQVYKDLGVEQATDYNTYTISVRDYSAIKNILYNATYLDQDSSEGILKTLSQASFDVGLVAGVPKGITVAHKFGEKEVDPKAPLYQLNDCGIIYATDHPYALCVMVQGKEFDKLAAFIAKVSSDVYESVTSQSN